MANKTLKDCKLGDIVAINDILYCVGVYRTETHVKVIPMIGGDIVRLMPIDTVVQSEWKFTF